MITQLENDILLLYKTASGYVDTIDVEDARLYVMNNSLYYVDDNYELRLTNEDKNMEIRIDEIPCEVIELIKYIFSILYA